MYLFFSGILVTRPINNYINIINVCKLKISKSDSKLLVGIGILILLIDIILMKYWVGTIKPYPFMSIGVKSYRLEIFGINILIGIIVFFIKKRLSLIFFINTIICYWIFSFFWTSWIENHPFSTAEFTFKIENRNFRLNIDKNPDLFRIDEIITKSEDSLITIGIYKKVGDSLILTSMQETMYFYQEQLIGFSQSPNGCKLYGIEWVSENQSHIQCVQSSTIGIFISSSFEMNKNTSVSLGNYFDEFVQNIIRAGLGILEEEENKVIALKQAIQEGIDSGIAHDFDSKAHLEALKAKKHSNGST